MDPTTNQNNTKNITTPIKCIQINLQHSRVATANLMELSLETEVDMLLLQEPYVLNNKISGITRKYRIFCSGVGRHRSAIILTNNSIDGLLIKQLSDLDTVVIEIIKDKRRFIVASLYSDINKQLDNELQKIEEILKFSNGIRLLIAMDSNSRSTSWHDTLTNARGKILEEFLISKQLYIINEESEKTTFHTRRGKSNVDITVVNNSLLREINQWEISDEESCSDHSIIKYDLGQNHRRERGLSFHGGRYIVKEDKLEKFDTYLQQMVASKFKVHWEGNKSSLDSQLSTQVKENTDVEDCVNSFYEALEAACNKVFTKTQVSKEVTKHRSVPWWTGGLTQMRKKVNATRRRYQRTKNDENLRENRRKQYFEAKGIYQACIKKEKRESWKQYCNLTASTNPWNEIYKIASGKAKDRVIITTLEKSDGSLTSSFRETLEYMADHFIPQDTEQDDSAHQKQIRTATVEPPQTPNDREFTQEEIRQTIENFDHSKAPGEDGITSKILLRVFQNLPKFLTSLYNGCLGRGCFPKRWKRAKIVPILKPGKENSVQVSKFRPISLLNTGGKILEKLLHNRIMHYTYTNNLMNSNQFGFTPQRNAIDAAMVIKDFVEDSLKEGKLVALVSLDVKGAFDAAWWPAILHTLKEFKCPRNLYNLTKNYFYQRTAMLSTNNENITRDVTKGCPQGSCCGPSFWNIQFNALLNLNFASRTKVVAFADDLILAVKGETATEIENFANIEMTKILNWSKRNKISFNKEKSCVMLVTRRKRREQKEIKIYLKNEPLKQVSKIKYLGIILDEKFTFKEHINNVAEKCTKMIHILSRSAKLNWGLQNEALKTIYKGAILPLLIYGAPVWRDAMTKEINRRKYIRVQRLINIKMGKAYRTTSNEALCILTGITPIIIKIRESTRLYDILKGRDNWRHEFDTQVAPKNWMHPAEATEIMNLNEAEPTLRIFTDGSKNEYGVGSGVAIFTKEELIQKLSYKLFRKCSNNQAEQLAIIKALQAIPQIVLKEGSPKLAIIYTDSQITIDSIKNIRNHNFLIEEIRKEVKILKTLKWKIGLEWIKAHAGTYGNELADTLAKEGAQRRDASECYFTIPKSDILNGLEEDSINLWQRQWTDTSKGETTKAFFPTVQQRLKTKINITPKFSAIITGHGKISAYRHRFKIMESAECLCSAGVQNVDHLIYQCPLLHKEREIMKKHISRIDQWPVNKSDLVKKYLKHFSVFINSIDFEKL